MFVWDTPTCVPFLTPLGCPMLLAWLTTVDAPDAWCCAAKTHFGHSNRLSAMVTMKV